VSVNAAFKRFCDNIHMVLTMSSRELRIEVAHNVRHLGGYTTRRGTLTRDGAVRAASLHRLTPEGVAALADTGIKTVVDLRSAEERSATPTPDLTAFGINHVAAAVFEQDASPVGLPSEDFPGFATVYERMLEHGAPAYRTLFGLLADAEGRVLFHCAAGKDRTGVAAALLLDLLEVPDETIVDDYTRSAELLAPLVQEWLPTMKERGVSLERAAKLMAARGEDMAATLDYIRRRYGSGEGYLRGIGVADGQVEAVKSRYAG